MSAVRAFGGEGERVIIEDVMPRINFVVDVLEVGRNPKLLKKAGAQVLSASL